MFCARCGQQIAEGTRICPACGGETAIPQQYVAPPTVVAPLPPPIQNSVSSVPQGVGGWLLFFCISFTILLPLWTLTNLLHGRIGYAWFSLMLHDRSIHVWFSLIALSRTVFGVVMGIMLWLRNEAAMVLLRIYLVLGVALFLWSIFNLVRAALSFNVSPLVVLRANSAGLGILLIFLTAAIIYFSTSERVRATYGSKLF